MAAKEGLRMGLFDLACAKVAEAYHSRPQSHSA